MTNVTIGALRYDILSDTTSFQRGMKMTRKELKQSDALFRKHQTPLQKVNGEIDRLNHLYQKGVVSHRAYYTEMAQLQRKKKDAVALNKKHQRSVWVLDKAFKMMPRRIRESSMAYMAYGKVLDGIYFKEKRNAMAARGGGGNRLANFGGSLGSALGFGGAGAGIGRMMGYGTGMVLAGGAALGLKKMIDETRELETALVDMQVIMGDDAAGTALVNNLREIARTTPLTSKALIKGAQTLLGYGLAADGLEDTMYRIGEIAGGDTMRMDSLTRAFAQVQSAGKLMGQEMLQLVNAGFPVAEIAKAAGVEMEDFRKEMEDGNIKASHLTQAMINLTSAGGMMEGRLARQADTINGKWITAVGKIDQKFAELGQTQTGVFKDSIESGGQLAENFIDQMGNTIIPLINEGTNALLDFFTVSDRKEGESTYDRAFNWIRDSWMQDIGGLDMKDIEAYRNNAAEQRFKLASDNRKANKEAREKELAAQRMLAESKKKEMELAIEASEAKTQAIHDEMKAEEDMAAMKQRHADEWLKAHELAAYYRKSGLDDDKYLQAEKDRMMAEQAKMQKQLDEEAFEAKREKEIKLANEKFEAQKKADKVHFEGQKKLIDEEYKVAKLKQEAIAKSGGYGGNYLGGYSMMREIAVEQEQYAIQNEADAERNRKLEALKVQQSAMEENRRKRHENLITTLKERLPEGV